MSSNAPAGPTTLRELLDADSVREAEQLRKNWSERASALLESEYQPFYTQTLGAFPQVRTWRDAMENHRWAEARRSSLWRDLILAGLVSFKLLRCTPNGLVGDVSAISPRICDAMLVNGQPSVNFAFTTVRVCIRTSDSVPPGVQIPDGWTQCRLIDCELFEIPHQSTTDIFDDREKIHIIYLAGMLDGAVVCRPCYLGVGTGEAYGVGPRHRATAGRFRFYRYDVKENFHCEHVAVTIEKTWRMKAVSSVPEVPAIGSDCAKLLDARSVVDPSFICVSDPMIRSAYEDRLKSRPASEMEFRQVCLRKVHDDLRTGSPSTVYQADDVDAVLRYTQDTYRWFACAWLHASRLTAEDGVALYFRGLPEYKRAFHDTMKVRPEYVPADSGRLRSVIEVLQDEDSLGRLEASVPAAIEILNTWWRDQVVSDLYASGGHPELRLQIAIITWQRMSESGWWARAQEAGYHGRLAKLEFGPSAVLEE